MTTIGYRGYTIYMITYEQWLKQGEQLLLEYAEQSGLSGSDELPERFRTWFWHKRCEAWINYKLATNQLII